MVNDCKRTGRERCRELKSALLELFKGYNLVQDGRDYEIRIKITSGNIAWININSIEIIK